METSIEKKKLKLKIDLTPTQHALCGGGVADTHIFFLMNYPMTR